MGVPQVNSTFISHLLYLLPTTHSLTLSRESLKSGAQYMLTLILKTNPSGMKSPASRGVSGFTLYYCHSHDFIFVLWKGRRFIL